MTELKNTQMFCVPPSRLAMGTWCHQTNKSIGEGDVYASYSVDTIALGDKIRKPFRLQGRLYSTTSVSGSVDSSKATAYQLMLPAHFDEPLKCYEELRRRRSENRGFYHGLLVSHGRQKFVLFGPPIEIVQSDEPEPIQDSLF